MKNILLVIFTLLFALGCKDKKAEAPTVFEAEVVIVGFDNTECACCGGFMINFDGQTTIYSPYKLAQSFPTGITVDENGEFPIHAKINWTASQHSCAEMMDWIDIDDLEFID